MLINHVCRSESRCAACDDPPAEEEASDGLVPVARPPLKNIDRHPIQRSHPHDFLHGLAAPLPLGCPFRLTSAAAAPDGHDRDYTLKYGK